MENQNPMELRKKLELKLIERAWKDEEFKKELAGSPGEVIERELGIKLPEGINVKVLEETVQDVYLVLPKNPAKSAELLNDVEHDKVTGGGTNVCSNPVAQIDPVPGSQGGGGIY